MAKSAVYLSNLTPLRGIAAMLTVLFHCGLMIGALVNPSDLLVMTRLYLMVDFFFILSGFIMLHVYGPGFADLITRAEFKRFTIARFARVYPLHFVMLIYTIALFAISASLGIPSVPIMQVENSGYSILTNLLLLQSMNLHNWFTWVHASWSISTEWWMYMVFPFLVAPFMRLNTVGRGVVAFLCFAGYVGIMYWIIPLVGNPPEIPFVHIDPSQMSINVSSQYGFLRCFFGFVLGMAMYSGFQQSWGRSWLANGYTLLGLTVGMFICFHLGVADVWTVSFFPFILLSAAYGSAGMNRLLGSKPLQRLGDWSFSIYLTHQPLMFTIGAIMAYQTLGTTQGPPSGPPQADYLTNWTISFCFVLLTLAVSYLTYRFVEVPSRRWINKRSA